MGYAMKQQSKNFTEWCNHGTCTSMQHDTDVMFANAYIWSSQKNLGLLLFKATQPSQQNDASEAT